MFDVETSLQHTRSVIRDGINKLLNTGLRWDDREHQNILATFGLPAAESGVSVVVVGPQHPIRRGVPGTFVLCPKGADTADAKSSLHEVGSQVQKEFVENFLGHIGRFEVGKQGMDINNPPFLTRAKGVNLFNDVYCWLYFHVFAAGQKMSWILPQVGRTLDDIFDRRVLNYDGSRSEEFMLSHRVLARWDFYIYTSIYASQVMITAKREFFELRVATYEQLDGKDGRLDWRVLLKDKLQSYLERFPSCTESVFKRKRSFGNPSHGHGGRIVNRDDVLEQRKKAELELI
jgi:hypothetical protein